MSAPCWKCGARPDVACRHRSADPDWQPPKPGKERKINDGGGRYRLPNIAQYRPDHREANGRNFRRRKQT